MGFANIHGEKNECGLFCCTFHLNIYFARWSDGSLPGNEEGLRCEPIKLEQCSIYKNYESTGKIVFDIIIT